MANWEGGESEEENVLSDAEMQFSGTCALLNFVFFYLFVFQNCRGAWRRGFSGAYTRTFVCVCVCVCVWCVCGVCVVCVQQLAFKSNDFCVFNAVFKFHATLCAQFVHVYTTTRGI